MEQFGFWMDFFNGCNNIFAGVQLVSIWMISEYIARIYDDTKQRPEYIINEKINIKEE